MSFALKVMTAARILGGLGIAYIAYLLMLTKYVRAWKEFRLIVALIAGCITWISLYNITQTQEEIKNRKDKEIAIQQQKEKLLNDKKEKEAAEQRERESKAFDVQMEKDAKEAALKETDRITDKENADAQMAKKAIKELEAMMAKVKKTCEDEVYARLAAGPIYFSDEDIKFSIPDPSANEPPRWGVFDTFKVFGWMPGTYACKVDASQFQNTGRMIVTDFSMESR